MNLANLGNFCSLYHVEKEVHHCDQLFKRQNISLDDISTIERESRPETVDEILKISKGKLQLVTLKADEMYHQFGYASSHPPSHIRHLSSFFSFHLRCIDFRQFSLCCSTEFIYKMELHSEMYVDYGC